MIVLFGASNKSAQILQSYFDRTLDLQTCALIGSIMARLSITEDKSDMEKYDQFYTHYKEFINKVGKFEHRAAMDKERFDLKIDFHLENKSQGDSLINLYCSCCKNVLTHGDMVKNMGPHLRGYNKIAHDNRTF